MRNENLNEPQKPQLPQCDKTAVISSCGLLTIKFN